MRTRRTDSKSSRSAKVRGSSSPNSFLAGTTARCKELGLLQRNAARLMGIEIDTFRNWEKRKTEPVAAQFRPVVELTLLRLPSPMKAQHLFGRNSREAAK